MSRQIYCVFAIVVNMHASSAHAFSYVMQPGETLANVAARMYGSALRENVLVDANHLDEKGGIKVVPGMRIEVPAPEVRRVSDGDTWARISERWLGNGKRAEWLAKANGALAWVPPSKGQSYEVFPVIAYVATESTLLTDVWIRHRSDPKWAWELNSFNEREGGEVKPREVILIPLADLQLTEEGRAASQRASNCDIIDRAALGSQRVAREELPALTVELSQGNYVSALVLAARLLGVGELTKLQKATVARGMLESYAALGETRLAIAACSTWRENADAVTLDPDMISPKILEACNNR